MKYPICEREPIKTLMQIYGHFFISFFAKKCCELLQDKKEEQVVWTNGRKLTQIHFDR